MLPILPWLTPLRAIGAAIVLGVLASGGAYIKGRGDGREAERVASLRAALRVKNSDELARAAVEAQNRAEIETAAKQDGDNDALETEILRPTSGDDAPFSDGRFMRDVKRFK